MDISSLSTLKRNLFDAMTGLARAAEEFEEITTDYTAGLFSDGITALYEDNTDTNGLVEIIFRINKEKIRFCPYCTNCKEGCGKTDENNADNRAEENTETLEIKAAIMNEAYRLAKNAGADANVLPHYIKALIFFSSRDYGRDEMLGFLDEIKSVK